MANASSSLLLSVVIPTHNPRIDFLTRVIEALKQQTLPCEQWEVLVVDNGSRVPLKAAVGPRNYGTTGPQATAVDLSWHPNARVVREEELGLTFARLRGLAEAKGELIVMVDDDNVLAPDYVETAVRIAEERPGLGAFGGKCLPEFEVEPPEWLKARGKGLGLRDRGDREEFFPEAAICEASVSVGQFLPSAAPHAVSQTRLSKAVENHSPPNHRSTEPPKHRVTRRVTEFSDCAPIGAGMVLRREAAAAYAARIDEKTKSLKDEKTITDRKGNSLASGGDNDICLTVVEEGWQVGYLPELVLTHLIPKQRMTLDYQRRMARDSMKSFILMLDQHGIRPWPAMPKWSLPLRVASDWWRVKPWRGPDESLRFWGHLGMYEGRAALPALPAAAAVGSGQ
jgi:glycosyltransferase involved in cell wall biosynthesis